MKVMDRLKAITDSKTFFALLVVCFFTALFLENRWFIGPPFVFYVVAEAAQEWRNGKPVLLTNPVKVLILAILSFIPAMWVVLRVDLFFMISFRFKTIGLPVE